ncbi:hypothetical protein CCACVL1_05739 [Corchorus capsularis]|uniref:Uncharacterized protein n=1 Tax=Corchorus capsularis TaxID=210143 RepID=A0A1R3JJ91_COCAP|nr:hypothetical protein CCACVL1_05739 [Corchorus capsularis]
MLFGGGKGMGGGAGGGGANMFRTVGRAVARAGSNPTNFQEPFSSSSSSSNSSSTTPSPTSASKRHQNSNNSNYLTISSGNCSPLPISANSGLPSNWHGFVASPASSASSCGDDEFEWVSVDESEGGRGRQHGFFDDYVLAPVPSVGEVQNVVSALQRVFDPSSCPQLIRDKFSYHSSRDIAYQIPSPTGSMRRIHSAGSDLDWMEPSLHLYNTRALQPYGTNRVYDAFHLLQTEPAVQKMVLSLSSDKAVWNAVLKNEVVRELRESFYAAGENGALSSEGSSDENSDESNKATNIVMWIFDNTKAKIMDIFDKITKLVNELFKMPPPDYEKGAAEGTLGPFEERLRTSFLLSVVVLLVVVVARANII